ncbi:MAG: PaaI family thioesterase [Puia sp.]|nr:PaaI family thioesterase [Puia sp.]
MENIEKTGKSHATGKSSVTERSRTIHWEDPAAAAVKAKQMAGLDYLQAIGRGEIAYPPLLKSLEFKPETLEAGKALFSFQPQEWHYNSIGSVHGGVISAILDTAMGCALHTLLPEGVGYTTLELKVNFLKTVTIASGRLTALGKIIHQGGRTALTEAQLTDEKGVLYAHALSTCLIIK